jgi:phosphoribosylglycinamide formyltransferase 2
MVTLAGTQNFNEFELHLRAVLGLPIPEITLERAGANAVILASESGIPAYAGLEKAMNVPQTDIRIFGKPITRPYRRMGVALAYGPVSTDINILRERAKQVADMVKVENVAEVINCNQ